MHRCFKSQTFKLYRDEYRSLIMFDTFNTHISPMISLSRLIQSSTPGRASSRRSALKAWNGRHLVEVSDFCVGESKIFWSWIFVNFSVDVLHDFIDHHSFVEVFDWCSTVIFHIFQYILLLQDILRCLDKCNIQGGATYKGKKGWLGTVWNMYRGNTSDMLLYLLRYRSRKTVWCYIAPICVIVSQRLGWNDPFNLRTRRSSWQPGECLTHLIRRCGSQMWNGGANHMHETFRAVEFV